MMLNVPLFCLRHGTAAGLESAVANLIAGIKQTGTQVTLPIASLNRLNPEFRRWVIGQPDIAFKQYPYIPGGMWTRFAEETLFYNMETARDPIIFPNYFLPPAIRRRAMPVFAYIHDCQHRVFPEYFSTKKRRWLDFAFNHTLTHAARVFLISDFEKSQIARFFGDAAADNCTVVYNPVDWDRYSRGGVSDAIRAVSGSRFILSVSHQYVHKNTGKIVDAFALLAPQHPEVKLVLVGRKSPNVSARIAAISDPEVRGRIMLTGFIQDADLGALYRACRLFVLASEYEGFGMPAVEAMGFGAPVIAANGSSLPEVTLGHAAYVQPSANANEWADAIVQELSRSRNEPQLAMAAAAVRARYQPLAVANTLVDFVKDRV